MSTPAQLRIAARIHYALKGVLGEGINVSAMLNDPDEAREVLCVCQASGNAELVALANQFFAAGEVARPAGPSTRARPKSRPAKTQAAPQDSAWGQDTSGFGISPSGDLRARTGSRMRWLTNLAQRLTR